MKKRLNVTEFGEYLCKHKPTSVNLCSENQSCRNSADTVRYQLTFPSVVVSTSPNVICLHGGNIGSVCVDSVKFVEIDDKPSVLGEVFQVHCHNEAMLEPRVVTLVIS